jgi:hypothetical protein
MKDVNQNPAVAIMAKRANPTPVRAARTLASTYGTKRKAKMDDAMDDDDDDDSASIVSVSAPVAKRKKREIGNASTSTISSSNNSSTASDAAGFVGKMALELMALERNVQNMRADLADFAAIMKGEKALVVTLPARK